MNLKYQKITTAVTVLVIFAVAQISLGLTYAERDTNPTVSPTASTQLLGILTTSDSKAITVNGASAITGATIPAGAVIETPDKVGATIRLGALGSICIAPNTKLTLEYDRQGNAGSVKVKLIEGCVIMRTLKNTAGTINSGQGPLGQTPAATNGALDVCMKSGAATTLNQGAAVDAGAGASPIDCGAAGAAAASAPSGVPVVALVAIAAGGAVAFPLILKGTNPSP